MLQWVNEKTLLHYLGKVNKFQTMFRVDFMTKKIKVWLDEK